MEGNRSKAWKNKRRKSLYNRESKEMGLLYRKLDHSLESVEAAVVVTRSQSKRYKHITDIGNSTHLKSLIQHQSQDTTTKDDLTHIEPVAQQVDNDAVLSPVNELSSLQSSSSSSVITGISRPRKDRETRIVEKLCRQFIAGVKKDIIAGVGIEIDQTQLDESMSSLLESLLSTDTFRKALHEPIRLSQPHDVQQLKKTQETKLKIVCDELEQWTQIATALSGEESNNSDECLLDEHEMRLCLNKEQLDILDSISGGDINTAKIEKTISNTEQFIEQLKHRLFQEATTINKRLEERVGLVTTVQGCTETPRTLFQQLKNAA